MLGSIEETHEAFDKVIDAYAAYAKKQMRKYNSKWPKKYQEEWLNKTMENIIQGNINIRANQKIEALQLKKKISKAIYEQMMLNKTKTIGKVGK